MPSKPPADSARARFANLLAAHLANGVRPTSAEGEPWTYEEFAGEVQSSRDEDGFASPRSVSNWCKATALPAEIEPILRALFGPPGSSRHAQGRGALRDAFLAARAEHRQAVIARAKPDPAGPKWVLQDRTFAIERTLRPSDVRAAKDPLRQQLQTAIREVATELIGSAARLANTRTWGSLSATVQRLRDLLDCDPQAMAERLGVAYHLSLQLGGFLETDNAIRADPAQADDPLDPDIRRLLAALVQTAAPWLRGFPTVAAWDVTAGKSLVRSDLLDQAHDFLKVAHGNHAISDQDAAEMVLLADAANAVGHQGQKASNRTVGAAWNLMLAMAGTFAASLTGLTDAPEAAQRAGATFAAAGSDVEAFATTMPDDLRHALRALVEEGRRIGSGPVIPSVLPEQPIPPDVEEQATAMILEGRAPPVPWRPFIYALDFSTAPLDSLEPLAGLANLQTLDLRDTQVGDVSPLAGLANLQDLNLGDTQVSDVSPLAGLAKLQGLNLRGTPVSDVSPLAGLANLQHLNLMGTQVSDVSPLAGLANLQILDLMNTQVSDVSPLAGLAKLQGLNLMGTPVSDVSPLAGLAKLQDLDLWRTQVSDVSPLAGLANLQDLNLMGTQVSDVSPLAGLANLQHLNLMGTQVSDVSPLAGLANLQSLYLMNTQVSDVSPLAGLANLQTLDLMNTQVSDVSPLAGLANLQALDLRGTQVRDISPVAHIRGLKAETGDADLATLISTQAPVPPEFLPGAPRRAAGKARGRAGRSKAPVQDL